MLTLIYGGSGSGKSAFAEQWVMDHRKSNGTNYYLATMEVYDKEGQKRVEKHRQMRSGKGFETVEYPIDIEKIFEDHDIQKQDSVLIECMSNLVANEMFSVSRSALPDDQLVQKMMRAIINIEQVTSHLCIVGNDIFRDGPMPTPEMEQYAFVLAEVQKQIAARAEKVIEVVYGIPIVEKG